MFKLSDLLSYGDIVIQCHDNPDADAVGSAFGVYTYLKQNGKNAEIVYSGFAAISKPNMVLMVEALEIPIRHTRELSPPELLICVDCQYGQGNVKKFDAKNVAVIDHHLQVGDAPSLGVIEPDLGSCATLVWDLLAKEGFDFAENKSVSTALYYGLFSDTNSLMEIKHPLDRDMRDLLPPFCDMGLIALLRNCNLTLEELELAGVALLRNLNCSNKRYALFKAEECDPNILGFISDIALQVDTVDLCVVFSVRESGAKFSVRSCSKEIMAAEFAGYLAADVGSGGGHRDKAGGFLQKKAIEDMGMSIVAYISKRTEEYFDSYDMIIASDHSIDTSKMKRFVQKPVPRGFAPSTDIFPENTPVMIRTLEGDSHINASPDIYLMVGIDGEVYPTKYEKFKAQYRICDGVLDVEYKYEPAVRNDITGERKQLAPFLKYCVSMGGTQIFAAALSRNTKVFTQWNPNGYMHGTPGDYLAIRCDDVNDVYIIRQGIFERTYEELVRS